MNSVSLVGRTTRDPELRYTGTGKAVTSFTLAINRTFSKSDEADFINIVTWEKTAENVANYVKKGHQVAVAGRIQSRTYDDKDGKRVFVTEVVANEVHFLEPKESRGSYTKPVSTKQTNDQIADEEQQTADLEDFQALDDDEDIPF